MGTTPTQESCAVNSTLMQTQMTMHNQKSMATWGTARPNTTKLKDLWPWIVAPELGAATHPQEYYRNSISPLGFRSARFANFT